MEGVRRRQPTPQHPWGPWQDRPEIPALVADLLLTRLVESITIRWKDGSRSEWALHTPDSESETGPREEAQ